MCYFRLEWGLSGEETRRQSDLWIKISHARTYIHTYIRTKTFERILLPFCSEKGNHHNSVKSPVWRLPPQGARHHTEIITITKDPKPANRTLHTHAQWHKAKKYTSGGKTHMPQHCWFVFFFCCLLIFYSINRGWIDGTTKRHRHSHVVVAVGDPHNDHRL